MNRSRSRIENIPRAVWLSVLCLVSFTGQVAGSSWDGLPAPPLRSPQVTNTALTQGTNPATPVQPSATTTGSPQPVATPASVPAVTNESPAPAGGATAAAASSTPAQAPAAQAADGPAPITPAPTSSPIVRPTPPDLVPAIIQPGIVPPARKSVIADPSETDRRLERLRRQLEQLHDQLSSQSSEVPAFERAIVNPFETPAPSTQGSDSLLNELLNQVPETTPSNGDGESMKEPETKPAPAQEEPTPPAAETPEEKDKPKADESAEQKPFKPMPRIPDPPPAEMPIPGSQLKASSLIKGLPTAASDRVSVADNLFAAGETVLAEEIYLQVDRKAISEDESGWVEFQLGNCARRAGRTEEARKRYRRVVADPALGWLQDLAKWRLDAIDDRDHLIREHSRLDAAIKQLSEKRHATSSP